MTDKYQKLDDEDEGYNMYFDRAGNPIKLGTWCRLFEDYEYKRVAEDGAGPLWVSTVWLGLNHCFFPNHPPEIFETMVFPGKKDEEGIGSFDEVYGPWRHCTEQQAMRGHQAIVGKLRELVGDESKKLTPGDVRALVDEIER